MNGRKGKRIMYRDLRSDDGGKVKGRVERGKGMDNKRKRDEIERKGGFKR